MATVAVFKTLFDEFKQENKCPTEEIVKKKYYFPVNRLKVKFFKCLLQIRFNLIIFYRKFTLLCLEPPMYNGLNFNKC